MPQLQKKKLTKNSDNRRLAELLSGMGTSFRRHKTHTAYPAARRQEQQQDGTHEREIRDRKKTMRELKRKRTPILSGYQIYHNYVRPHEALGGKTPAEACGIMIEGKNKWKTLIENAGRKTKLP